MFQSLITRTLSPRLLGLDSTFLQLPRVTRVCSNGASEKSSAVRSISPRKIW